MTKNRAPVVVGLAALSLLVAATFAAPRVADAQVPSIPNPAYNQDLGALITNSLRTAGTVTSGVQTNTNWRGVACRFVQTASSGSPSTTFAIQSYDAATNSYISMVTSGAITDTTATEIVMYPGIQTTSLPSAMVAFSGHLPWKWRLTQTVGGSATPASTSKIGCNYLN